MFHVCLLKLFKEKKIILLKPNTYMNNSGLSAIETQSFYKIKNENIFVFHDEIDLEVSKNKKLKREAVTMVIMD